jgi:CMP-N,N'-diacetyllegionaminic acid synthase
MDNYLFDKLKEQKSIAALIIGRGNNTLKDKNILPVLGRPLLQWAALAAKKSDFIDRYYISSEDDKILNAGHDIGYKKIKRPEELSTPDAQSSDVVKHALSIIENDGNVDIIIVIHANVGTINSKMIDDCIKLLLENPELSSVVPSHIKNEYHPLRAKKINSDGLLVPFVELENRNISANRQDLESCIFFDHSFWVLSVANGIKVTDGQQPWPVMGNNILPYMTEGCFDVHDLEDLKRTEDWIIANGNLYPEN